MNNTIAVFKKGPNLPGGYASVLEWLFTTGLTLENPKTGKITHYSGPGGGPFETDLNSIRESLANDRPGSAQLWYPLEGGIFVSWGDDGLIISFAGMTDLERQTVVHALTDNLFARSNRSPCSGCSLELFVD